MTHLPTLEGQGGQADARQERNAERDRSLFVRKTDGLDRLA
jgi:hypothetical protein